MRGLSSSATWRWLKSRRIAVLKGGWSKERAISLKTGASVEQAFKRLNLAAVGMDVTRNIFSTLKARRIDFCFLALHGAFGEDGRLQGGLDVLQIPYTGSGALASALAMDKDLSKKIFVQSGLPTPAWQTVSHMEFERFRSETLANVSFLLKKGPLFIKPVDQGSAIGASRVDKRSDLIPALERCFRVSGRALVERFVHGRELTVAILGNTPLPVIEIIPKHRFYDFHSKYASGGSRHIVPADLTPALTRKVQHAALKAFQALTCMVYGRVDLILEPNGKITVLEVNTIPGMTNTSLLPEAAQAAGLPFDRLVLRIMEMSLKLRKGRQAQ